MGSGLIMVGVDDGGGGGGQPQADVDTVAWVGGRLMCRQQHRPHRHACMGRRSVCSTLNQPAPPASRASTLNQLTVFGASKIDVKLADVVLNQFYVPVRHEPVCMQQAARQGVVFPSKRAGQGLMQWRTSRCCCQFACARARPLSLSCTFAVGICCACGTARSFLCGLREEHRLLLLLCVPTPQLLSLPSAKRRAPLPGPTACIHEAGPTMG